MVRDLLVRGMLVGVLAGLLVFAFGRVIGEPPVGHAIAFEAAADAAKAKAEAAAGHPVMEEPEMFSRATQSGVGLFTGVMVYSVAFGGLFALVFAVANGRMGALGPQPVAALVALGAFVVLYAVPNLKYPANPPAIGEPETIGMRTALYFAAMAASVVAACVAITVRPRLVASVGAWSAGVVAVLVYLVLAIGLVSLLPAVNEVPEDFPATVLWNFRLASFGMQAVLWATLGLGLGAAVQWDARRRPAARLLPQAGLR